MSTYDPMLAIRDLYKSFGTVEAVNGVNLVVDRGKVVVVIGPSGSGKSTLLRCINHLEIETFGEIWIDGERLTHDPKQLNRIRAEIGMVFQHFNLYPHLTVMENITLAQQVVRGREKAESIEISEQQLSRVGILGKRDSFPSQLSGGQQQRVAIARALAMKPKIMLFDEPTSALDPEMIKEVLDVMLDLVKDGITMVAVTHEMSFARRAADEIVFMDHGKVVENADPETFFTQPKNERTQQFLSQILNN